MTAAADVYPPTIRGSFRVAVPLMFAGLFAAPPAVPAQERDVQLSGDRVAMYNLAGEVRLVPGGGGDVRVAVRPGGADAGRLRIEQGPLDIGRSEPGAMETLRIVYPGDRILYPGLRGSSSLRVREDGTFWGDTRGDRGREVEISGRRGDVEAWADLEVSVPPGKGVFVMLATGRVEARNVDGDLHLDTGSGEIVVAGTTGELGLDTGSGDVTVEGAEGEVSVDTGSGDVTLRAVRGPGISVDTGSGNVAVDDARAPEIELDTGSGDVRLLGARTGRVNVDTGSGNVTIETIAGSATVTVDTGSGDVEVTVPADYSGRVHLETNSGRLRTDLPIRVERKSEDVVDGRIGDGGAARLEIDTGSGDVSIRRG